MISIMHKQLPYTFECRRNNLTHLNTPMDFSSVSAFQWHCAQKKWWGYRWGLGLLQWVAPNQRSVTTLERTAIAKRKNYKWHSGTVIAIYIAIDKIARGSKWNSFLLSTKNLCCHYKKTWKKQNVSLNYSNMSFDNLRYNHLEYLT